KYSGKNLKLFYLSSSLWIIIPCLEILTTTNFYRLENVSPTCSAAFERIEESG
ncbi:unnamed protein product, partial [Hymenolepis diminuta]